MKTKEFIRRVEELGFTIWITGNTAYILEDNEQKLIRVAVNKAFVFDYIYLMNESIDVGIKEKLFDLVVEYVKTPIKDREEEKKFYLKHKWENKKFTRKEIEEIKEKFDTDLADFEEVEVKE